MSFDYLIAFGSSIEPRSTYIKQSFDAMAKNGFQMIQASHIYRTKPIGNCNNTFLNGITLCRHNATPSDVLTILQDIENNLGRQRHGHWIDRTIDLDIILCRDPINRLLKSFNSQNLVIPHPEAKNRDFVLIPAAELQIPWINEALDLPNAMKHCRYYTVDGIDSAPPSPSSCL
ncbi:MAG: 2-amino-4-hydroxy-6-hydroxymethyldihydropteridine diphosphokinase [Pseudobacteriovorax sp.]|nr:2-amino-4-hydroxy-6-hydroxymethyldihydropteridine diphosphokinase [Pseudobacteriovorax sp.]